VAESTRHGVEFAAPQRGSCMYFLYGAIIMVLVLALLDAYARFMMQ
jgi:hypothetical protein